MALTPVEIRHIRLGRGFRGYKRQSVDTLLVEVAESFEDVWRERADLTDKVEQLELDLVRHKELEGLLRTTLVSAESAAQQLREQARKEAETIVGEAHAEARAIARRASSEKERLETELRRIKSLLRSALDSLDEASTDEREPVGEQTGEIRMPSHDEHPQKRILVAQPEGFAAMWLGSRRALSFGLWLRPRHDCDFESPPARRPPASSAGTAIRGRCASLRRRSGARRTTPSSSFSPRPSPSRARASPSFRAAPRGTRSSS